MSTKTKAIYELDAELRTAQGKGASRRLRRLEDRVPAIVYGGKDQSPTTISLDQKKVMHALANPGFYSHILTLNVAGKKQQVLLKDLQRHHFKKAIMHMDFFRVNPTDVIVMRIPLHFNGADVAPGIEAGGIVNHRLSELEVRCQVQHLPTFIEVDISKLEMDQTLHISDLKLPKGVESVALSHGPEHDHPVVAIHLPKVIVEETPVVEAEETEEGTAETATAAAGTATAPAGGKEGDKQKSKEKGA